MLLVSTLGCSGGNTCKELQDFYADNPGDSNRSIARDYYHLCDVLPPPVISGELDLQDIQ